MATIREPWMDDDDYCKAVAGAIRAAIRSLDAQVEPAATEEERDALLEVFHVEGFGGAERHVDTRGEALDLAIDRLDWLRAMREEGVR